MKKLSHGFTIRGTSLRVRNLLRRNLVNVNAFTFIRTPLRRNLVSVKGFTLIELLIVIAIVAALSTAIVFSATGSLRRSRDTQRKSDVKNISTALEVFNTDYGFYPPTNSAGQIMACPYSSSISTGTACVWGDDTMADTDGTVYLANVPADPSSTQDYVYSPSSNQDYYFIFADLESPMDNDSERLGCTSGGCSGHDFFVASSNAPLGVVGALPTGTPTSMYTPTPTSVISTIGPPSTNTPTPTGTSDTTSPTPTTPPAGCYESIRACTNSCFGPAPQCVRGRAPCVSPLVLCIPNSNDI